MTARLHAILARHKAVDVLPGALTDFTLAPPGDADPMIAAQRPWALYCLDFERGEAMFVELPDGVDLADAPFSGVTMFRLAARALIVPLDALEAIAARAARPETLAVIYSMGRCGSTLLNALLNASPPVWALSEPAPFDAIQDAIATLGPERAEEMLRLTAKLLYRPPPGRGASIFAVKLRSQSLFGADLIRRVFPAARNVFLYRDGLGWADSRWRTGQRFARAFGEHGDAGAQIVLRLLRESNTRTLRDVFGLDPEDPGVGGALAASWALHLERFEALRADGMVVFPLRYDDLRPDPDSPLARLFDHIGAPAPSLEALEAVLARDSQIGTSLGRDAPAEAFDEGQRRAFLETLARHPLYGSPDWRAPERA